MWYFFDSQGLFKNSKKILDNSLKILEIINKNKNKDAISINKCPEEITLEVIKESCLYVIENMVHTGIDIEYRKIGTFHALSALTIVSEDARQNMQWLYDSII
jgi:hypothetical protein